MIEINIYVSPVVVNINIIAQPPNIVNVWL